MGDSYSKNLSLSNIWPPPLGISLSVPMSPKESSLLMLAHTLVTSFSLEGLIILSSVSCNCYFHHAKVKHEPTLLSDLISPTHTRLDSVGLK